MPKRGQLPAEGQLQFFAQAESLADLPHFLEAQSNCSPQPPIVRTQRGDPLLVEHLRVPIAQRMIQYQRTDVPYILLVHLNDLELSQEQLGERQRDRLQLEPVAQRDRVAHVEL